MFIELLLLTCPTTPTSQHKAYLNLSKNMSPVFVWETKYLFFSGLYIFKLTQRCFSHRFYIEQFQSFLVSTSTILVEFTEVFVRYSTTIDSKLDIFELLCIIFQSTKQKSHYKLAIWTDFHLFNFKKINIWRQNKTKEKIQFFFFQDDDWLICCNY